MQAGTMTALHARGSSLIVEQRGSGTPVWRHAGGPVDPAGLPPLETLRGMATFSMDADFPLDLLPTAGAGSFFPPAIRLRHRDDSEIPLVLRVHEWSANDRRMRLVLVDEVSKVTLELLVETMAGSGFRFTTKLANQGACAVEVLKLASATIPLPASAERIVSWRGRHNAEFVEAVEPMPAHGWVRETRRGLTGHGGPCGAYILARDAGHHSGLAIALQLAWSGDARLAIERSDEGFWVMQAEALFQPGECVLQPGESYEAPAALLGISTNGRNGAMAAMHDMVRAIVDWPAGEMKPRPVHLNSWEACYFAHDEARIGALAEAAASVGAERFVLDDGWFKGRVADTAGLGDWMPDSTKYPRGLGPLAEKVRSLGMEFGLWVEPEMVNPDSDLYRSHPDWVLHTPHGERPTARNQLVLDLRSDEVRDYLFTTLDTVLKSAAITYLKWDHNRDHAPVGGLAQTRGAYDLLGRIRAAHPQVEIESCAGGGGRIDAGIAQFAHRFWTSDNIDAVARVPMQRGFLAWMPPETMGCHVGASPSHATGRVQSLPFRAAIACQGHFGIEMDPAGLDERERETLGDWVSFYKTWRHLVHGGRTWLGEASDGVVWQAQGSDEEMLLWVVRRDHGADKFGQPVPLPFLATGDWDVRLLKTAVSRGVLTPRSTPFFRALQDTPCRLSGSWLAQAGLPVPALPAESALIFHLKAAQ